MRKSLLSLGSEIATDIESDFRRILLKNHEVLSSRI
jgi:hypothetical protein